MSVVYEWIDTITQSETLWPNVIFSLIVGFIILIIQGISLRHVRKKHQGQIKRFATKKLVNSIYLGLYVIILLVVWYESSNYIIAFLGVFSAGIAFGIRDIIVDMIGGMYILWAVPFKIGDRIQIGEEIGDVIDVSLLHFSVLEVDPYTVGGQSTGRIMQIPNMMVFSTPFKNYEKGFRFVWHEMKVNIHKDSDWEKAKGKLYELLEKCTEKVRQEAEEQIHEAGKSYAIYYNNLTPIIYTQIKEGHIAFTLRFLCEPRKVRITEHLLWEGILKLIKEEETIHLV